MKGVPQVYQMNPAFQPGCKFFIGLPGLSPLQLRVQEHPLTLKDIIYWNDEAGKYITPFDPFGDKQAFLNTLGKHNYLNTDIGIPIISIGWGSPSEGRYMAFDITQKFTSSINYPRDLARIPIEGLDSAMNLDFSGFGINASLYTEIGMNISRKIGDMVTVGWRGKFLIGQANLNTSKFDVGLSTGEDAWTVNSDIQMNAKLPFLDVQYDQEGMINMDSTEMLPFDLKTLPKMILTKNLGLAMDLGVDVRPMDWLQLSASVIDLGYIKWKDEVHNLKNTAEYEFTGFEVTLDESDDPTQALVDTLTSIFKFPASNDAYRTWLPTKVFLGATFYVHPKISFGVLSRTDFYKKDLRQQFTVSANLYPIKMISTSFSYSIMEGSYKNLGMGLSLKLLPFNLYIITDTGPSMYFWPMDAKYTNLRIGMNMMFGCRQKKGVKYDLPLVN
jgi:hypothetical protein